jgi:cyclopropane fatty-acyl-phospholipid synthase-like methyltransferase
MNTAEETKRYHLDLYKKMKLFEKGSWLEDPEEAVIELAKKLEKDSKVLDLGSGVGRNSIPIAKIIGKNGKVVCVDYLRIAIKKLRENSRRYGVEKNIEAHLSDIKDFRIRKDDFDFIITHSVLEHLNSKKSFESFIRRMIAGTKEEGYNYICSITGLQETDVETKKKMKPMIEIRLETEETKRLFRKLYRDWKIISLKSYPYSEVIQRNGRKILWKCKYLLLTAER